MAAPTRVLAVILGSVWLSYAAGGLPGAAGASGAQAGNADVVKSLVGVWRAPEYRMKRTSEVGERIFGPNAFDVRTVELTLQPSGEGLLKDLDRGGGCEGPQMGADDHRGETARRARPGIGIPAPERSSRPSR